MSCPFFWFRALDNVLIYFLLGSHFELCVNLCIPHIFDNARLASFFLKAKSTTNLVSNKIQRLLYLYICFSIVRAPIARAEKFSVFVRCTLRIIIWWEFCCNCKYLRLEKRNAYRSTIIKEEVDEEYVLCVCWKFQLGNNQSTKNSMIFEDVWHQKSPCEHVAKCNNFHIT